MRCGERNLPCASDKRDSIVRPSNLSRVDGQLSIFLSLHYLRNAGTRRTARRLQEARRYHQRERSAQAADQAILGRALEAELTDHLGYEKHDPAVDHLGNTRNGKSPKNRKAEFHELELETPRDNKVTFKPKIVA